MFLARIRSATEWQENLKEVFCCCENVKLHRSPLLCVHENDKLLSVAVFKSIYTNPQQPLYLNMYFI